MFFNFNQTSSCFTEKIKPSVRTSFNYATFKHKMLANLQFKKKKIIASYTQNTEDIVKNKIHTPSWSINL